MDPSTVSIASVSDMALSIQSRRHVPSMPMMQTLYPRLKATRSGALLSSDTLSATPHHSKLRRYRANANGRRLGRRRARTAGLIQTAPFRIRLEDIGQPDHGFGCSQHEETVRLSRFGETVEDVDLGVLIEVDQNVPAENHIEDPELGKIVQQIQLPILNHGSYISVDLPELSGLLEVLDQHLDRKAALDFELAVYSSLGFFEHLLRKVGREDFDPPA